jgi:hypothetical protein
VFGSGAKPLRLTLKTSSRAAREGAFGASCGRSDFLVGGWLREDGGVSEKKNRLEQALDLFLYAPLGLALSAREELPRLVEKGRKQFSEQATTARVMGEYALQEGRRDLEQRVQKVTDTVTGLTGTRRPGPQPAPPQAPTAQSPHAAPAPVATTQAPAPSAPSAAPTGPRPSDDGLAIPGYDALSASQVVQRLAGLSTDELEAVRAYESATRGRKTILHRVDQLQSGPA